MRLVSLVGLVVWFLLPAAALGQGEGLAEKSRIAKELMAAGRFEEAIPLYEELVRVVPGNPGLIMNLGMARHLAGRDREAIGQFQTVLKLQPGHVPAQLFLGAAHLRLGEPARAVEPLRRVVQAQPHNREARAMLADALFLLQRVEQAAEQFRMLSELDPENPKAWYGLGRSYEALALRGFQELEKVAPESGWWLALVAEARARQRQFSSAFYLYRQALGKMPTRRGLHAALAEIYRHTGHADWAAVEEERERQLPPADCKPRSVRQPQSGTAAGAVRARLGKDQLGCDFAAGRHRELLAASRLLRTPEAHYWQSRAYNHLALQAFSRLTQLPPSAEGHELLAEIHRSQGRHVESVKEWQEARKFSPDDPRLQKELVVSLHLSRDYQSAQPLLEGLLRREPDSPELNYLFGEGLLNSQQAEDAIPFLKKAVEGDAKLLAAHSALARAYLQAGQSELAIPHLKAALPTDEDGSLHYQLARAYQASGQQELARQILEKYQEIRKSQKAEHQALEQEIQITPP